MRPIKQRGRQVSVRQPRRRLSADNGAAGASLASMTVSGRPGSRRAVSNENYVYASPSDCASPLSIVGSPGAVPRVGYWPVCLRGFVGMNAESMDIATKIFDIVAKEKRIDAETLSLETKLEDIQIESVDLVEIIFAIEDEFDIDIPQDETDFKLETMRDIVDGVKRLIAEKQGAADAAS
jgi:acyl carrier protein